MKKYYRLPDILKLFGFQKTTWYNLIKKGLAPRAGSPCRCALWEAKDIALFGKLFAKGEFADWSEINAVRKLVRDKYTH